MALNRQSDAAGAVGAARGPLHVGHNEEDPLSAVKLAAYGAEVALLDTLNAGYSHLGCVRASPHRSATLSAAAANARSPSLTSPSSAAAGSSRCS